MEFNSLPLMEMMTKKMSWLSRRTEVISQNVAHADTPNFKARDLKKVSFQDMVRKESQARRRLLRAWPDHFKTTGKDQGENDGEPAIAIPQIRRLIS